MSETMICIAALFICTITAILTVLHLRREPSLDDLFNYDTPPTPITSGERTAWFGGTLILIVLLGLMSWMSQRDARVLEAERANDKRQHDARVAALVTAHHDVKISFNKFGNVEAETGRCIGIANPRKKTTVVTCAE